MTDAFANLLPRRESFRVDSLLAAMQHALPRREATTGYRIGLVLVATAMIALPIAYAITVPVVFILLCLAGVASFTVPIFGCVLGPAMIATAFLAVVVMLKPFFVPLPEPARGPSLLRQDEPALFAVVDRMCEVMGAPKPKYIDVTGGVEAAATFRGGFFHLFGGDVVLILGMPLLATLSVEQAVAVIAHELGHFQQGRVLRLNVVVSVIAGWFHRVVYERDKLDIWLHMQARQNLLMMPIAWVMIVMIWCVRRLIWLFLAVAALISQYQTRQLEYDADRAAATLAGSATFESMMHRVNEAAVAYQASLNDIPDRLDEFQLIDDLPRYVRAKAATLSPEKAEQLKQEVLSSKTGLLDSHPCESDRLRAVRAANEPGMIECDLPASVLFKDFVWLSKATTYAGYREMAGAALDRYTLVDTAHLVAEMEQKAANAALARSYCGGATRDDRLPYIKYTKVTPPKDPQKTAQQIRAARDVMATQVASISVKLDELSKLYERSYDARAAVVLARLGLILPSLHGELEVKDESQSQQCLDRVMADINALDQQIAVFDQAMEVRLISSLRMLRVPVVAKRVPDAAAKLKRAAQLLPPMAAAGEQRRRIEQLDQEIGLVRVVNDIANHAPPEYVAQVNATFNGLIASLSEQTTLLEPLIAPPKPKTQATQTDDGESLLDDGTIELAVELPPEPDIGFDNVLATYERAKTVVRTIQRAYLLGLGELIGIALEVERLLKIKPVAPPSTRGATPVAPVDPGAAANASRAQTP